MPAIEMISHDRLVFDAETMGELVALVENRLSELRAAS